MPQATDIPTTPTRRAALRTTANAVLAGLLAPPAAQAAISADTEKSAAPSTELRLGTNEDQGQRASPESDGWQGRLTACELADELRRLETVTLEIGSDLSVPGQQRYRLLGESRRVRDLLALQLLPNPAARKRRSWSILFECP